MPESGFPKENEKRKKRNKLKIKYFSLFDIIAYSQEVTFRVDRHQH